MVQVQGEDKAQAQAQAQAQVEVQAWVDAYVTPELLECEVDRNHRSFLSAVLGEDLGHIQVHTTCTLLSIHDLWVPKYVN
jgi:hypothetical protein